MQTTDLATLAAALRLGDRLLAEQCETGDPASQEAVATFLEVLTQRLAECAEADAVGLPAPPPPALPVLVLPGRAGRATRPTRSDQVSTMAMAWRLREAAVEATRIGRPGFAGSVAPVARDVAAALEEHAAGLDRLARRWAQPPGGGVPPQAAAAHGRLHAVLLGQVRHAIHHLAG